MKLYYAPGACSLAPYIVAREAGLTLDLDKLDFATRITEGGEVRPFLNVFVNGDDIRFAQGLQTPVRDGDEVSIIPSIAGGR